MFLDGDKYFEIAECAAIWIFTPTKVPFGMDSINVSVSYSTLSYQLGILK